MSGITTLFGYKDSISDVQHQVDALSGNVLPIINKGDLITRNNTNTTRLQVGLDNQVLTSDSSTATGLKWSDDLVLDNVDVSTALKADTIQPHTTSGPVIAINQVEVDQYGQIHMPGGATTLYCSSIQKADAGDPEIAVSSPIQFYQPTFLSSITILGNALENNNNSKVLTMDDTGTICHKTDVVDTNDAQTLTNKTINSANNTVQINGTNVNSLINQDVRTTASPTFTAINMPNVIADRKLVLYPGAAGGKSFYGLGVAGSTLKVQVDNTSSDIRFYAATSSTTENELFHVKGTGGVQFPNSTSGYTPTSLNYYEEGTFNATFGGAITTTVVSIKFTRIGNNVTLQVPTFNNSFSSASSISSGLMFLLDFDQALQFLQALLFLIMLLK